MNIYCVAYGSHEDSSTIYFHHEVEYIREEFEQIVLGAMVFHLKAIKAGHVKLFDRNWEWPSIMSISDLFPEDIVEALKPYGFKVIKPKQEVVFSGWQDPFNFDDTDWTRGEECATTRLGRMLEEHGFTKADSGMYERDKEMKEKIDEHDKENNTICRTCGMPTRSSPFGDGPRDKCWWCSQCGDGCHCDYSSIYGKPDPSDEEDYEFWYGW